MPEITIWSDAESPLQVEYKRGALEKICARAMEGLMDLPRIGLGIGGVLLGEREGNRISILDSFELPCSHTFGPSFSLTAEELAQSRKLIAESDVLMVIGWYCSKGLRPLELTDSDRTALTLFSGPWLVGLLLQPQFVRPTRFQFFSLDASSEVVKGELLEWGEEPTAVPSAEMAPVAPVANAAKVERSKASASGIEPAHVEGLKVEVLNGGQADIEPERGTWAPAAVPSGHKSADSEITTIDVCRAEKHRAADRDRQRSAFSCCAAWWRRIDAAMAFRRRG